MTQGLYKSIGLGSFLLDTPYVKFYQNELEVFQVRNLVLYFLLLILEVLFNLISDIIYKCRRFSKIFSKKNLKFVPNGRSGTFTLNPSLMLLPVKANLFLEE